MISFVKSLIEQWKWLPEILGIIAAALLIFKSVRVYTWKASVTIFNFFSFPFTMEKTIKREVTPLKDTINKTAEDVQAIKELIGYNGGTGLMDQIGYIIGYQSNDFWFKEKPGFICDRDGRNIDCTYGYCSLLGLKNKVELLSYSWKSFVDKESVIEFLEDFKQVSERKETFRQSIRFFDSHGDDIGVWLIIAHPISSNKAKTPRYIGFLYPYGEKALAIARDRGWPLTPPL